MLFESREPDENSSGSRERLGPRGRMWLSNAGIFALTAASTTLLMLCPCDLPGESFYADILVVLSALFGLAAAVLVYWRAKALSGITEFLKAVIALAVSGALVYGEFTAAGDAIAWLARRGGVR
jgi:hypothetical protein